MSGTLRSVIEHGLPLPYSEQQVCKELRSGMTDVMRQPIPVLYRPYTGVNPAGDAGDTSPNILVGGTSLVSRLSACLTEANSWRLIAE